MIIIEGARNRGRTAIRLQRYLSARRRSTLGNRDGMRDGALHEAETFHRAAWLSRQGDHQRVIDDRGQIS